MQDSSISRSDEFYQTSMNTLYEAQASFPIFMTRLPPSWNDLIGRDFKNLVVYFNSYSLLEENGGKADVIFPIFCYDQSQPRILTVIFFLIVGLEPIQWLHWLYDYT